MSVEDTSTDPPFAGAEDTTRRTVLRAVGVGLTAGGIFAANATARSDALAAQFNAVRAATRPYRDRSVAEADGYTFGPVTVPGVGRIVANPSLVGSTTLTEPAALIYTAPADATASDGTQHVLAAVEYLVPGNRLADLPDVFADESSTRRLQVTEAEGWHYNSDADVTGLHVWVHRGNPAGVFSLRNPTV